MTRRLAPDMTSPMYTPQRVSAVVAALAEDGVAPADALKGSAISVASLNDPSARVSYEQVIRVFRNALALARDPTIALRAGNRMHVTAYGIWGYALLSSRTCADVLDFAIHYRGVIGPLTEMTHNPTARPPTCGFRALLTSDATDPIYRFSLEFTYAAHLRLARDIFGEDFSLSRARVAYRAPDYAARYRQFFGCPVDFSQTVNEISFDEAWLDCAPRTQDPITHAMATDMCRHIMMRLDQSGGMATRVRQALLEQMPWRFPRVESMAERLSLDARALRRRLEAQGTSYRKVLSEVRLALALEYLQKTNMTTEQIATRLGYSDAANFRHAFARWTGKSPQQYREI